MQKLRVKHKNIFLRTYFCASQIQTGNGEVTITNDGATILKQISVTHPAAKMVNI
jgi:ribosomal protein L24E